MNPGEHSDHTPTEQPVFGMKRAAEIAGISVSTIRRNRSRLEECGAKICPEGWEVPISALVASGLMRGRTPPEDSSKELIDHSGEHTDQLHQLQREILELRHQVELAEEQRRSAERQAGDARELARVLSETLTHERRMLTSSTWQRSASATGEDHGQVRHDSPATGTQDGPSSWFASWLSKLRAPRDR